MPSKRDRACVGCQGPIARENRTGRCRQCLHPPRTLTEDRVKRDDQQRQTTLAKNYAEALKQLAQYERELAAVKALADRPTPTKIVAQHGTGTSEGTVVLVASDWHVEEQVSTEVGTLNRYNPDIARTRAETFFAAGLRLTELLQQDLTIQTMVLALLGDFISGDIHEEFADLTSVPPMHAVVQAQNLLIGGIEYILGASALNLIIPCHSGNHARTTRTTRFSSENGHSLEYLMYLHLAAYFRHEPRVRFIIPDGYHSYLDVYDLTLRFHHGHAIKYAGGVGGIYIPVNKAIAQWNKAKHADLDVFGHFHQLRDGGNFICNGSQIGYNGFALSIKADYESPKQALFLVDKKRGRTCTWPIVYAR